jgi:hypothetical protein
MTVDPMHEFVGKTYRHAATAGKRPGPVCGTSSAGSYLLKPRTRPWNCPDCLKRLKDEQTVTEIMQR